MKRTMLKVLLVDDDPSLLAGLRRALLNKPSLSEIRFARDGQEGLDILAAETADLVISDMRMPGMDGATFLERVMDEHPHTVRIVLSGYGDPSSAIRSIPVAHQFLSKPCASETLLRVMEQARGFYEQLDDDLRVVLAAIVTLPSPDKTVSALRLALKADESASNVAAIVESDIALTSKLLQLANSAFFGLEREVFDVKEAVMRLGTATLQSIFSATEICRLSDFSGLGISIEDLQSRAVSEAGNARSLAVTDEQKLIAGSAGMLHELGLLALASEAPHEITHVEKTGMTAGGVSPTTISALLLSIWGIPAPIVEAVRDYPTAEFS